MVHNKIRGWKASDNENHNERQTKIIQNKICTYMTRDNEQQNKPETTMIHNEKSPG